MCLEWKNDLTVNLKWKFETSQKKLRLLDFLESKNVK